MLRPQIELCRARIADEEGRELKASSVEARHAHAQMAMLYKARLAMLIRETGGDIMASG